MTNEELEQRRQSLGEEVRRLTTTAGKETRHLTDAEVARVQELHAERSEIRAELDDRFYRDYMNRPRPPGVEWSRPDDD